MMNTANKSLPWPLSGSNLEQADDVVDHPLLQDRRHGHGLPLSPGEDTGLAIANEVVACAVAGQAQRLEPTVGIADDWLDVGPLRGIERGQWHQQIDGFTHGRLGETGGSQRFPAGNEGRFGPGQDRNMAQPEQTGGLSLALTFETTDCPLGWHVERGAAPAA